MRHLILFIGLFLATLTSNTNSQDATVLKHENYIDFHWKGGLTSHSIIFKIFPNSVALRQNNYNVFLAYYIKTEDDDNPIRDFKAQQLTFDGETNPVATVEIISLAADTEYSYTFIVTGDTEVTEESFSTSYPTANFKEFEFKTLGIALKPYNFTFGASCCAQTGSSNSVFEYLKSEDMSFFLHTGDLHSEAIATNDVEKFYNAYYSVLNSSVQKRFFQEHPIYYVWNNQDFGPSNSNGNSVSKPAATEAYTRFVPASTPKQKTPKDDFDAFEEGVAPLASDPVNQYVGGEPTNDGYGIYRSFIVGRCLFIILDLKSYKDIQKDDILGSDQRNWLQNQLIFAKSNTNIVQVFLVSSIPWIHTSNTSDWAPYAEFTQEFIESWVQDYTKDGRKLMMISGDAHMVAFDDGTNNQYGGFPVVQAGALDQNPSCKGGPYSHGLYTGRQHFALFDVVEYENGTLCVKVHLENPVEELIFYDTCHPKKSGKEAQTCPLPINEEAKGGTSSWLIFVVGLALLAIVAYLIWSCYKNYSATSEASEEKPEEKEGTYMELSETKKKRENDHL